jgi:hypothetical protein
MKKKLEKNELPGAHLHFERIFSKAASNKQLLISYLNKIKNNLPARKL